MKFEGHLERHAWWHSSITTVTRGQEEAPQLEWRPRLVCPVMAAISCVVAHTLRGANQGCSPYTQMSPALNTHTHARRELPCGLRAQIWRTTWKEERQTQTRLFSQLWYAKHTKATPAEGAKFCRSVFSRTHGEDIEELCSALMHWLWSYVMCLSRRWREMAARANIRRNSVATVHLGGRPCRVSNAAARHSVTNNAWMVSLFQTLLLSARPTSMMGKH